MDRLSEAIKLATNAFDGMKRKCEERSAVMHSLEAALIVQELTDENDVVIAAVLHDTVEDAGITVDEIELRFGERVKALVLAETENKRKSQDPRSSWRIRKEEAIALLKATDDVGIKALYLGDKLSNLRALRRSYRKMGDAMWNTFNQNDPKAHAWYYNSIKDALSVFEGTEEYREYTRLIAELFQR